MPKAFEKQEFEARLVRVKQSMQRQGLDVLVVACPANIDYLTGYNVQSYTNIQAVLVDLNDAQPHWLGRFMDTGGARLLTYLDDAHIHHYVDDYMDAEDKHPYDKVVELVQKLKLANKRIGVEKSTYFMQPKSIEVLVSGLPNAVFSDGSRLVNWVRTTKSAAELNYMREAAVLTDLGMQAGFDAIDVGKRENEVAAEILSAMVRGTSEIGGFASSPLMMPTGAEFATTYHTSWADRPYLHDTSTGFEFTGARYHYSAPLARNVYLGQPPEDLLRAAAIMIEGLAALEEGLKAGMTGEEGEQVWRDVAIRQGVDKEARIGYAVGLDYPPGWSEQTVSLRPGSRQVLEENMTIHCIPSLMLGDWGLEISETMVIGRDRSEALSQLPRDVVVKA